MTMPGLAVSTVTVTVSAVRSTLTLEIPAFACFSSMCLRIFRSPSRFSRYRRPSANQVLRGSRMIPSLRPYG